MLATWGISLLLIQTVRLIFGAQNVTVANPSWLSGGVEILPQVVLTYSRLAVIAFSVVVMLFVWVLMQKTRLGLEVRAVTQNRAMAAAMGISTRRVDMWTSASAPALPAWAASRSRSSATWVRSLAKATSSTPSWSWCWAASVSWPARLPAWAWAS